MYKRILMPLDGSPHGRETMRWGLHFAKILTAEVTFLHAIDAHLGGLNTLPSTALYRGDIIRELQAAGKTLLANATTEANALGVPCSAYTAEDNQPARAILEAEGTHDLTLMATHSRRRLDRLFLGSVTETVLRRSDKPHLILRGPDEDTSAQPCAFGSFKQFLLPVDGSFCSDQAVEEGLKLAKTVGAEVTLLYALEVAAMVHAPNGGVTDPRSIRKGLERVAHTVLEKTRSRAASLGVEASVQLKGGGWADQAILEAEGAVDLTVMGTHGRRGVDRALLGSITERVLRQSSTPNLIVRCQQD